MVLIGLPGFLGFAGLIGLIGLVGFRVYRGLRKKLHRKKLHRTPSSNLLQAVTPRFGGLNMPKP